MKRKYILLGLILALTHSVSAIDVSVENSCKSGTESLLSLNKTDGGHVAEPGYYPNQLCVEGADKIEIGLSCGSDNEPLFSLENKTNSHLSIFENHYTYSLCSGRLQASIEPGCTNGTKALSVTGETNTHAASPQFENDAYDQSLCVTSKIPENVTLEVEGVSGKISASDSNISTGEELKAPVEYPYITSEQPLGIVGYGEFLKLSYPETETISMTLQDRSTFLVPFSNGGRSDIEERQKEINDRILMNQVEPSFGDVLNKLPLVKVIYRPNTTLENTETIRERGSLRIGNSGLRNSEVAIKINPN
ncbi:MAG: hypothetical protein H8Z69_00480 [Nanohaloarchaea archaeon]|nr:hypothetical protein [Candidatus Nanohaloarchaea archaeon]